MGELLQRIGSMEVAEWIAELSLRAKEKKDSYEAAKNQQPSVMGGR